MSGVVICFLSASPDSITENLQPQEAAQRAGGKEAPPTPKSPINQYKTFLPLQI